MAAASNMTMKLLIDTQKKRVLFAEAGKECVDFLFYILSLPVATVVRLLKKNGMSGCLANLYKSVEGLNETYIEPGNNKDILLNPRPSASLPLLLTNGAQAPLEKKFYRCPNNCQSFEGAYYINHLTDHPGALCPKCSQKMATVMKYVAPPPEVKNASGKEGFVKGVVTYMVMDDLMVKPMSTISSIALLNQFNVKDMSAF